MFVSAYLVIAPIASDPQIEYLYAFLFIIGGLVFYLPFVYLGKVLPGTGITSTSLRNPHVNDFVSLQRDSQDYSRKSSSWLTQNRRQNQQAQLAYSKTL